MNDKELAAFKSNVCRDLHRMDKANKANLARVAAEQGKPVDGMHYHFDHNPTELTMTGWFRDNAAEDRDGAIKTLTDVTHTGALQMRRSHIPGEVNTFLDWCWPCHRWEYWVNGPLVSIASMN